MTPFSSYQVNQKIILQKLTHLETLLKQNILIPLGSTKALYQASWLWQKKILKWNFLTGKAETLQKTVATIQAQLEAPHSTTLKMTAFNAIVHLVRKTTPTEVLVTTDSPQKKGRGEHTVLFEPQAAYRFI